MSSIETRLTALSDAVQRRAMEQVAPIDGLSASLFALKDEFAALDEQGKMDLLTAMNTPIDDESGSLNLSMENLNKFIENFMKG